MAFNAKRVRDGVLWSAGRAIFVRTAGMLTMMAAVRMVSPEDFGVWAVALTVHAVTVNSAELGVGSLLIRRDTDAEALAPSASFIALAFSAILGTTLVLFAPMLASGLGAPAAAPVIRIMAVSVVLAGLVAVPSALLAREFRQRAVFVAQLLSTVVSGTVLIIMATRGAGAAAFAWSLVCGQLVGAVVTMHLAGRWYRPRLDTAAAGLLLRVGAPLAGANVLNYAFLNLDYVIVGRDRGAAALGVYLLAFSVSSWPYSILGASINSVSMPAFSDVAGPALQARMESTVQTVAMVAFPAAAMIAALAGPLIGTVYGPRWSAAAPTLSVLAPYGGLFLMTLVMGSALVGVGRSGTLLMLQALWLATLLPVMIVLVRSEGPTGAAIAHLLVVVIVALPAYLLAVRKGSGVEPGGVLRAMVGPAVIAALAGLCAWLAAIQLREPVLGLLVGGSVGTLIYGVLASPLLLARLGGASGSINRRLGPPAGAVLALAGRCGVGGVLFNSRWQRVQSESPCEVRCRGDQPELVEPRRGNHQVPRPRDGEIDL
ncbi:MAG: oligosaccharide flippase family protein [Acidimicrobiales bacterium]